MLADNGWIKAMSTEDILHQITEILDQRKGAPVGESYVAGLYAGGLEKILAKISEEAGETVEAGAGEDLEDLVHEVADLWFHCMVLLAYKGLGHEAVLDELAGRFGVSGLVEKARRKPAG